MLQNKNKQIEVLDPEILNSVVKVKRSVCVYGFLLTIKVNNIQCSEISHMDKYSHPYPLTIVHLLIHEIKYVSAGILNERKKFFRKIIYTTLPYYTQNRNTSFFSA